MSFSNYKLFSFKTGDRSKYYVACFVCISEGFPKQYSHGSIVHRRDKLKEHFKTHHAEELVQEWQFLGANKKQRKLFNPDADNKVLLFYLTRHQHKSVLRLSLISECAFLF